jgi:hypothetical protein
MMRPSLALTIHFVMLPAVQNLFAVLVGIAGEQSGLPAMLDQFTQRAAGLHQFGRQFVHAQKRPVADRDAACRVEHAQALRHVIESVGEAADLGVRPPANECAGGDGEQRAGNSGHHGGKQRDRHLGASRSWTTMVGSSCGLVNKTPPPAVVRLECGGKAVTRRAEIVPVPFADNAAPSGLTRPQG